MKRNSPVFVLAAVLTVLSFWLQREFARGSFDAVERRFAGWLAANCRDTRALPPLVVVLYDEESSELSGASRMAVLDGTLFARAASKLGAVVGGVEGLQGNPSRMLEAAGRMPLFGGFSVSGPPAEGWTPCPGETDPRWPELPGLTGAASVRFPRGFFAPPSGVAGPRNAPLVARNTGRTIPSFLAMAWAAAQGLRSSALVSASGRLEGRGRFLPVDSGGACAFFAETPSRVMTLNDLLVASEDFERGAANSPLRGCVAVLCRATPDVARIKGAGDAEALTPAELWAGAWQALRKGR